MLNDDYESIRYIQDNNTNIEYFLYGFNTEKYWFQ